MDETIRTARELVRRGRFEDAEALSLQLQESSPGVASDVLAVELAEARFEFGQALDVVTASLGRHGEQPELLLKHAQVLMHLRRRKEGFAVAQRAAELAGADPALLHAVATIYIHAHDPQRARPLLLKALELAPDDPAILYRTALSHFYDNQMEAAGVLLERMLALAPGNGFALHIRSQLATQTRESNHIADLREILARPRLRDVDAMMASFALAKELEDVGEFEPSFDVLLQANRLKRRTLSYDVANDVRAMQNIMANYSRPAMDAISDGDGTPGPIFVLGMPRTGTTLVERILGSHEDVASAGEAVDFPAEMTALAKETHARSGLTEPDLVRASLLMDFGQLGRNYRAAVGQLTADSRYTIDKLPFNFRYCGLIHKALPGSSIVHLTRDPMDTCYAVFKTLFVNAYHFSYQLDELAEFYVAYRRTMDHWHAVMPGVILDLSYEQLVSDPESQCRRLLAHCGLPWQDGVLDFHQSSKASTTASTAQVRQPFYLSSVQKWRNHARQLEPVRRRLAAAGLVDDDGNPSR